jgi:Domain of unknown function (DUF4386)
METNSTTLKNTARLAGILYFIWIATGMYAMFYVPSQINMKADAATAAGDILSHELLFRTGIVNGLVSSTIWVFMVLVFYRLFKSVNEQHAKLLVALVIVQIPIGFAMEAFSIASLTILKGDVLTTFELSQRQDLAFLFLKLNDHITTTLLLFWGLWLFPLGLLTYRSLFLPRFLGLWLLINGIAFLILSFTSLLLPQFRNTVFNIATPAMLGELVFMLWLLIMGAKLRPMKDGTIQ